MLLFVQTFSRAATRGRAHARATHPSPPKNWPAQKTAVNGPARDAFTAATREHRASRRPRTSPVSRTFVGAILCRGTFALRRAAQHGTARRARGGNLARADSFLLAIWPSRAGSRAAGLVCCPGQAPQPRLRRAACGGWRMQRRARCGTHGASNAAWVPSFAIAKYPTGELVNPSK